MKLPIVALLLLALVGTAHAGEPDIEGARALVKTGTERLEAGDVEGALEQFRAAYRRWKNPQILINVGTALRALGRDLEAAESYDRFLADPTHDEQLETEVNQALAELEPKLGRLEIRINQAGARVKVDGKLVGDSSQSLVFHVAPGSHTVVAEKQGFPVAVATVVAEAGSTRTVELTLTASGAPAGADGPDEAPPAGVVQWRRRPWHQDSVGWLIAGTGTVALGVGIGLLVNASSIESDGDAEPDETRADELYARADSRRTLGTVFALAGGAVAALGVVKLIIPFGREAIVSAGPGHASLGLRWRY